MAGASGRWGDHPSWWDESIFNLHRGKPRPETWGEALEQSILYQSLVEPVIQGFDLFGDVGRGEVDPRSDEVIERVADLAMTIPMAGLAAGGSAGVRAGGKLFSGAWPEGYAGYKGISDPLDAEMEKLLDQMRGKDPLEEDLAWAVKQIVPEAPEVDDLTLPSSAFGDPLVSDWIKAGSDPKDFAWTLNEPKPPYIADFTWEQMQKFAKTGEAVTKTYDNYSDVMFDPALPDSTTYFFNELSILDEDNAISTLNKLLKESKGDMAYLEDGLKQELEFLEAKETLPPAGPKELDPANYQWTLEEPKPDYISDVTWAYMQELASQSKKAASETLEQIPFITGHSEYDKLLHVIKKANPDTTTWSAISMADYVLAHPGDFLDDPLAKGIDFDLAKKQLHGEEAPTSWGGFSKEEPGVEYDFAAEVEELDYFDLPESLDSLSTFPPKPSHMLQEEWEFLLESGSHPDDITALSYPELSELLSKKGFDLTEQLQKTFEKQIAVETKPVGFPQKEWDFLVKKGVDPVSMEDLWDNDPAKIGAMLEQMGFDANDPFTLKPLAAKHAWMAKPAAKPEDFIDTAGVLTPGSDAWKAVMEELYIRDIDPNIVTPLMGGMKYSKEAQELSKELMAMLPEDWQQRGARRSVVVPHAVYTGGSNTRPIPQSFPDDPEALARAQSMGFNTDQVFYKGTQYPEFAFLDPQTKPNERALFFSDNPKVSKDYGNWLYPTVLRMEKPLVKDVEKRSYGGWIADMIEEARAGGYDSAIAKNMYDLGGLQDQYMILDPTQARSIYAKFDPTKKGVNNLLAAKTFGFDPFAWLEEEER